MAPCYTAVFCFLFFVLIKGELTVWVKKDTQSAASFLFLILFHIIERKRSVTAACIVLVCVTPICGV